MKSGTWQVLSARFLISLLIQISSEDISRILRIGHILKTRDDMLRHYFILVFI